MSPAQRFATALMNGGGEAYELRLLPSRVSTIHTTPESLAKAALEVSGSQNVYCTLNPLPMDHKGAASDHHVSRVRRFGVDIDVRKGKEPATEAEQREASRIAKEIAIFLQRAGWPKPLVVSSGNGYWVIYQIDQANSDDNRELRRQALEGLKTRFAVVDTTVYNASRVTRVPGTINLKGERLAELKQVGDDQVVTDEQLEKLASLAPERIIDSSSKSTDAEDILAALAARGITTTKEKLGHTGGRILELSDCPFEPGDGHETAACLYVFPDGCGFGCQGNRCNSFPPRRLGALLDLLGLKKQRVSRKTEEGDERKEVPPWVEEEQKEVAPWDGDLAGLLNDTATFIRRYLVMGRNEIIAYTLWIAHTYVFETAGATPYLNPWSPEPGSGKTTAAEVGEVLTRRGMVADDLTGAALFRLTEADKPTLFLDEIDDVFAKKNNDGARDIRKLLNSGYRKGKLVIRCGGPNNTDLERFNVYCPKAIIGLNRLPGTLAHRSIPINMEPPLPGESYADFDFEDVWPEAAAFRARFRAWAETAQDALRDRKRKPPKLDGLDARGNQIWRILFRIATLAGEPWITHAKVAALALSGAKARADDVSYAVLLLADIRKLFGERDGVGGKTLVSELNDLEEAPWGDWDKGKGLTTRKLGKMLVPYVGHMRDNTEGRLRGYRREQLEKAWKRYLPPDSAPQTVQTVQTGMDTGIEGDSLTVQEPSLHGLKNAANPDEYRACTVSTVSRGGTGTEESSVPLPDDRPDPETASLDELAADLKAHGPRRTDV